jgi:hypothetical protein
MFGLHVARHVAHPVFGHHARDADPAPPLLPMACLSSQDGATALFAAALHGRLEVVERLIAARAEVNAVNKVV